MLLGAAGPEAAPRVTKSGVATKSGKAKAGAPGEPVPHLRRKRPSSPRKRAPTTTAGERQLSVPHVPPRKRTKAPVRKMTAAPRRRQRSHRRRPANRKKRSQHHRSQRSSCKAAQKRKKRQMKAAMKRMRRRAVTLRRTTEKGSLPRTAA